MKKVRYVAGALGALGVMPALGLVAPAATAAPQAPARAGKTVSLAPSTTAPCDARIASGISGNFFASFAYSRDIGCIGRVYGHLKNNTHTGLWMRNRFYTNGHQVSQKMNKSGHIVNSGSYHYIWWQSYPRLTGIQQVCEAVVTSAAPSRPIWGPICQPTGFQT